MCVYIRMCGSSDSSELGCGWFFCILTSIWSISQLSLYIDECCRSLCKDCEWCACGGQLPTDFLLIVMTVFASPFVQDHVMTWDRTFDMLYCRQIILSNTKLHFQGFLFKLIFFKCDSSNREFADSSIRPFSLRSGECRLGSWDKLRKDSSKSIHFQESWCSRDEDVRIGPSCRSVISGLLRSDAQIFSSA